MKKFLLLLLFFTVSLYAEEENDRWFIYLGGTSGEVRRQEGPTAAALSNGWYVDSTVGSLLSYRSNFSFADDLVLSARLYSMRQLQPVSFKDRVSEGKVGFEYLMGEGRHFGLNFQLSEGGISSSCRSNCGDAANLLALNIVRYYSQTPSSNSTTAYNDKALQSSLLFYVPFLAAGKPDYEVKYNLLKMGLKLHLLPGRLIDPYIGFDIGGGTLQKGGEIQRASAIAGIRFNLGKYFAFFMEGESQTNKLTIKESGGSFGSSESISVTRVLPAASMGLGIRF